MRIRHEETKMRIVQFVTRYIDENGFPPSMQEIADEMNFSKATATRYVQVMCDEGKLNRMERSRSVKPTKIHATTVSVPVVGSIACGTPILAESNIDEYVRLPVSLFGYGEFFLLRAVGDSMIGVGIDDGDLVLVRRQNHADPGQVVVALIEDEATLKRFYPEPSKHRIRLHPENDQMQDIYVKDCVIQGVAVNVIKKIS